MEQEERDLCHRTVKSKGMTGTEPHKLGSRSLDGMSNSGWGGGIKTTFSYHGNEARHRHFAMLADCKGFMLHRGVSGRGVSRRVLDVESPNKISQTGSPHSQQSH